MNEEWLIRLGEVEATHMFITDEQRIETVEKIRRLLRE